MLYRLHPGDGIFIYSFRQVVIVARGKFEYWLTEEGLTLLAGWARDGLTDEQIAKNMGIRRSTLADWKSKYPDISDTLKKGKEIVDVQVENALLKRALGYDYTEESIERGPQGTKVKQTVKHVVADTTAQIFWLKNRRPDKWRDKVEPNTDDCALKRAIELLGGVDTAID